jgi:ribonucleotide monophosphatase NagD (HAD superfamily)
MIEFCHHWPSSAMSDPGTKRTWRSCDLMSVAEGRTDFVLGRAPVQWWLDVTRAAAAVARQARQFAGANPDLSTATAGGARFAAC